MKYIDWLTKWLENYVRPSIKVRTYERYMLIIEKLSCPPMDWSFCHSLESRAYTTVSFMLHSPLSR